VNNLIKTLEDAGFSTKEAKVYLTLLDLGVGTVSEISRHAGLNRSSTYVVLESLKRRGFIGESPDNKKVARYLPFMPEIIARSIEGRARKGEEIKEKFEKILPELRRIYKDIKLRPRVIVYEGQDAIKKGYHDIFVEQVLEKGMSKFRVYEDLSNIFYCCPPDFIKDDALLLSNVVGNKKMMYVISPRTKETTKAVNEYKKYNSPDDFLLIPEKKFNYKNKKILSLSIYEDKVEFFSKERTFNVIIENQEIADTLKSIFDLAWKEAKRLDKSDNNTQHPK